MGSRGAARDGDVEAHPEGRPGRGGGLVSLAFCEIAVRVFVAVRNAGPSFTEHHAEYGKRLKRVIIL
jgi:hypothetical protein